MTAAGVWGVINQPVILAVIASLVSSYVMTVRHDERIAAIEKSIEDYKEYQVHHDEELSDLKDSIYEMRADFRHVMRDIEKRRIQVGVRGMIVSRRM